MPYQTQLGTMPHRVVQLLKSKPAGTELATAAICEELEVPGHQVGSFCSWMSPARLAGLLAARRVPGEGRMLFWRLGDGVPVTSRAELEDDGVEFRRTKAPELQPRPGELFPGIRGDEAVKEQPEARRLEDSPFAVRGPSFIPVESPQEFVPAPFPFVPRGGRPMTLAECARAEEKTTPRRPFDVWLSGVTGELVLQNVQSDADGDVVLDAKKVAALRRVLLGVPA